MKSFSILIAVMCVALALVEGREENSDPTLQDLLRRYLNLLEERKNEKSTENGKLFEMKRPIGKISSTSGKGADYSAGSVNIEHGTGQSGSKVVSGYQKSDSIHSYGAGALNIEAHASVPKTKENLAYGKGELSGQSSYGAGAVGVEQAADAPKTKHEGLGHVDTKEETVYEPRY